MITDSKHNKTYYSVLLAVGLTFVITMLGVALFQAYRANSALEEELKVCKDKMELWGSQINQGSIKTYYNKDGKEVFERWEFERK